METVEKVGIILRKASLQLDELINESLAEYDEDEDTDPLETAQRLVEHSNGLIIQRKLQRLREIYTEKMLKVPKWFRDIFQNGEIKVHLVPTFHVEMKNACTEFKDMQNAKLTISLSPLDTLLEYSRPAFCQIQVSEELRFTPVSSKDRHETILKPWRRPLTFISSGKEYFCVRRVILSEIADGQIGYRFCNTERQEKDDRVKIIFINNNSSDMHDTSLFISGVYRRLMRTRDQYLTWKFVV